MYKQITHYPAWVLTKSKFEGVEPDILEIQDMTHLSNSELDAIDKSLSRYNFCLYQSVTGLSDAQLELTLFGQQMGLDQPDAHLCLEEDKITKIFDNAKDAKSFYIPYTNKPINWHTDGYYNAVGQVVQSFVLHCNQPAAEGGINGLLDQDLVFIYLMQQNPLYIDALMQADVMTVPENRQGDVLIRPETSTAIFSVSNIHDVLMRYSMRKKNIFFKQDALTQEALACMDEFINSQQSPSIEIKLKADQGVISNNVLHKRSAFKDKIGSERLYYRARYYNRIQIK